MNTKGEANISKLATVVIISLAMLSVLGLIVASMNNQYSQNNTIPINDNNYTQEFVNYLESSTTEISDGTADTQTDAGITLSSSWGITKSIMTTVSSVLTGGFIEEVVNTLNLGEAGQVYAVYLRILFILTIIFAILYILFKVKP